MNDLIFSLNATMPVFILILIGWFLGRTGMLTSEFTKVSNKFVFHIALPALLIVDISSMDIQQVFDIRFVVFCMVSTTVAILKNPIIIGIFIGMIDSILHIYEDLPVIVSKPLSNLASIGSPLALLTIGAEFEGKKALKKMKPTLWAAFYKLIGMPLCFIPIAIALGFRQQDLIAFLIMLGAPTTVSSYIMAVNMEHDGVLASSIVVLTTLLSAITLTVEIYILKMLGLV